MIQLTASVYAILWSPDILSQSIRTSIVAFVQPSRRRRFGNAVGAPVTVDRAVERANAANDSVYRTMMGTV